MKKLLILITLFIGSNLIIQENLGLMDFRKVPADEMKTFMQNEYVYWKKLARVLKKKDKSPIGQSMLEVEERELKIQMLWHTLA